MLRGVAVLQTDGTVRQQVRLMQRHRPTLIDTRPPTRSYRHFLPRRDLPRLAGQLAPVRGQVVMLGAGDFHHLTAALLQVAAGREGLRSAGLTPGRPTGDSGEMPENPAGTTRPASEPGAGAVCGSPSDPTKAHRGGLALVVVDAHPEWSLAPPGYLHCGSWLAEVLHLPWVQAVALVGVSALEAAGLLGPAIVHGVAGPAREGRLRVYPARRGTVRELHAALWWPDPLVSLEDGLPAALADLAQYLNGLPLYLSIDKDVVQPDELPGPWGGGELAVHVLFELVEALAATSPLVGADICGEHVTSLPPLVAGDATLADDPARRLHEEVNLQLLATLVSGAGRPTSRQAA